MSIDLRFRTHVLTTADTVNGHLVTPVLFDSSFTATRYRFKSLTLSCLTAPGTRIWVKGALADPWVEATQLLVNGAAGWLIYAIDQIYIKTDSATATIGLVAYISDSQGSGY